MSDVASLDNCRELFEISEWEDTRDKYRAGGTLQIGPYQGQLRGREVPAYSLGYLLRKLPAEFTFSSRRWLLYMQKRDEDKYYYAYTSHTGEDWPFDVRAGVFNIANTPEDALTQLAIQLFKQGILKRKG